MPAGWKMRSWWPSWPERLDKWSAEFIPLELPGALVFRPACFALSILADLKTNASKDSKPCKRFLDPGRDDENSPVIHGLGSWRSPFPKSLQGRQNLILVLRLRIHTRGYSALCVLDQVE